MGNTVLHFRRNKPKMKFQLFAVLLVIAGSYALPRANDAVEASLQRNHVENRIRSFIERISTRIQNAGLDPLVVERRDFEINQEAINVVAKAFVENLSFSGSSDIKINDLEYSFLFNRLRLDISLPEISLSVGNSGLDVLVLGRKIEGQLNGSLNIKNIRLAGVGYVDVDIIDGITLRSVSLNFGVGDIKSDFSIVAQGNDHSDRINNIFNERIPNFLENNKDDINRALENVLSSILNRIWSF